MRFTKQELLRETRNVESEPTKIAAKLKLSTASALNIKVGPKF